jgi:RNA-directed DNA polymerase
VQVLCSEGLANHTGPESCAGVREGVGEALTGECIGQPWSREMVFFPGADAVGKSEGNTDGRVNRECPADPVRSETLACADASCAGTGRSRASVGGALTGVGRPASGRQVPKPMMNDREKSHSAIVAAKPTNNAAVSKTAAAEPVEPRAGTKRNTGEQSTHRTLSRGSRDPGAQPCTASRKATEEGEVHLAPPSHQRQPAPGIVPRAQARCRPWRGWRHVEGLRC